ncbi:Thymidylate kinase [Geodermatophilus sabuli]|uniref:Thymidylate kinase n=1 Tax=Geodermatophilus sabuli TaxID=1564158 RepID=A0A285EIP2_9ACTN|nr:Thymidylate kinase [Geodermatophilus sabuli]
MRELSSVSQVAHAIDDVLDAPVLVTGSPPPHGRDLDLLARCAQSELVRSFLEQQGFLAWHTTWARFDGHGALTVELMLGDDWASARGHDGAELMVGAVPLPGFRHLSRPAPHVQLVLTAQSLLLRRGRLTPGGRRRATDAAASGPRVWDDAADLARRLGLTAPVEMLRRSLATPEAWASPRRTAELLLAVGSGPRGVRSARARGLVPRRWRPTLVSLSGPDGSGKSTQRARLRKSLEDAGVPTAGAWVRTTERPPLPGPLRAFADRWRRPVVTDGATPEPVPALPGRTRRSVPVHVRLAERLWITSVVLSNATLVWRGVWQGRTARVLVLDRFVLDAEVKLVYWYALRRGADITLERRLFRAICPEPDVAVLLAVAPETNSARRADEWQLHDFRDFRRLYTAAADELGAVVVDGERPPEVVAREVAEVVWSRLP